MLHLEGGKIREKSYRKLGVEVEGVMKMRKNGGIRGERGSGVRDKKRERYMAEVGGERNLFMIEL